MCPRTFFAARNGGSLTRIDHAIRDGTAWWVHAATDGALAIEDRALYIALHAAAMFKALGVHP